MLKWAIAYRCSHKITKALKDLQLKRPVQKGDIKAQYYRLAKLYHPDSQTESTAARFQDISEAYKQLKDLSESEINSNTIVPPEHHERHETSRRTNPSPNDPTSEYFKRPPRRTMQPGRMKVPLYRVIPELFFGIALVVLALSQYAYVAYHRTGKQITPEEYIMANQEIYRGFALNQTFKQPIKGRRQ